MTQNRMTVLQVLPALHSGGVERGVLEVAEALVAAGHRSLVVSAGGPMVEELVAGGSEHFTCPIGKKSPLTLGHIPWLRKLYEREQIDIIDIHSRMPGWIAWLAWKSLPRSRRPKFISSLHGAHSVSRYSEIMCSGETVIVVSESLKDYVLKNYPRVDPARLRLVHRGIEEEEYPRGYRPDQQWLDRFYVEYPELRGKQLITLAGRITRLKGHIDLFRSVAELKAAGVDAHALIVGGAEAGKTAYLEELHRNVAELGLQNDVTFTGRRGDLKDIYAISNVVVSLSQTPESFGRTVAEALSIGTPVVAWDHGGVAEILAAHFPQGAVPMGDLPALSARLREILQLKIPPEIPPNQFTRKEMLSKTLSVYEEVLTKQSPTLSGSVPPIERTAALASPSTGLSTCLNRLSTGPWTFIQLRGEQFDPTMLCNDDIDLLGSDESIRQLIRSARDWMRDGLCHFRVRSGKDDKLELYLYSIDGSQKAVFDLWRRVPQLDRGKAALTFDGCSQAGLVGQSSIKRLPAVLEACVYVQHLICKRKDLHGYSAQSRLAAYASACEQAGETKLAEMLTQARSSHAISSELEQLTLNEVQQSIPTAIKAYGKSGLVTSARRAWVAPPRKCQQVSIIGCDGAGKTTLAETVAQDRPDEYRVYTGKHLYRKTLSYKLAVIFLRPIITRSRERFDELLAPLLYLRAAISLRIKSWRSRSQITLIDRSLSDFLYVGRKTDQPRFFPGRWLRELFGRRIPTIHCNVSYEALMTRKQEMTGPGHAAYDQDMFEELAFRTPTDYIGFCNDLPLDAAVAAAQNLLADVSGRSASPQLRLIESDAPIHERDSHGRASDKAA